MSDASYLSARTEVYRALGILHLGVRAMETGLKTSFMLCFTPITESENEFCIEKLKKNYFVILLSFICSMTKIMAIYSYEIYRCNI